MAGALVAAAAAVDAAAAVVKGLGCAAPDACVALRALFCSSP